MIIAFFVRFWPWILTGVAAIAVIGIIVLGKNNENNVTNASSANYSALLKDVDQGNLATANWSPSSKVITATTKTGKTYVVPLSSSDGTLQNVVRSAQKANVPITTTPAPKQETPAPPPPTDTTVNTDYNTVNFTKQNKNYLITEQQKNGKVFKNARLVGKDLTNKNLNGVDLTGANLAGAQFDERTTFEKTILKGAFLDGASMGKTDLRKAIFGKYRNRQTRFFGADLHEAKIQNVTASGVSFNGANLIRADLSGSKLSEASFAFAKMNSVIMQGTELISAILTGADLSPLAAKGTQPVGDASNLTGANLSLVTTMAGTNLSEVIFNGANLSGADFTGAVGQGTITQYLGVISAPVSFHPGQE